NLELIVLFYNPFRDQNPRLEGSSEMASHSHLHNNHNSNLSINNSKEEVVKAVVDEVPTAAVVVSNYRREIDLMGKVVSDTVASPVSRHHRNLLAVTTTTLRRLTHSQAESQVATSPM